MRAEIVTSLEEFKDIKDDWNNILGMSISNVIFLTWEWMYSWAVCFIAGKRELFVVKIYDDGNRLVGIAPWYTDRISIGPASMKQVGIMGSPETASDYLDVFAVRGREKEVSNFIYDYLFGDGSIYWDCLNFQDVKAESLFLLYFIHKHRQHGRHFEIGQGSFCPIIKLPETEAEFLSQISPNRSKRFRQDLRTLKKTDMVEIETYTEDGLENAIDEFFILYEQKTEWDGKDLHRFITTFNESTRDAGKLQIDFLLANGNTIGGLLHLKHNDTLFLYLMAVDKKYNTRISAGNLLVGLCVIRAIESRFRIYDFLKGYEEYKFYWTSDGRTTQTVSLAQRKALPIFYMIKRMGKNTIKTIMR